MLQKIRLDAITVDPSIQPRAGALDKAHVADIVEAIKAGSKMPAPVAFVENRVYLLAEGFHRHEGHVQAGSKTIEVDVRNGNRQAAALHAMASNQSHGLKRTNADKRRAVIETLKLVPEWTDRRIAEHLGVGADMVGDARKIATPVLSDSDNTDAEKPFESPLPIAKRVGKDGREYQASKPKVTGSVAPEPEPVGALETAPESEPVSEPIPAPAATEPADTPEAEEEPPVTPGDPCEAFCDDVAKICRDLDTIGVRIESLSASPYSHFVHWSSAKVQVKNGRESLWQGRPVYVCPYCRVAGEVQPACRCCRGLNVTTKSSYKAGVAAVGGEDQ